MAVTRFVGNCPPANPSYGDMYIDDRTYITYLFDGKVWDKLSAPPKEYTDATPTYRELEKHPTLKAAWDEYLVIRKLLGL